MPRRGTEAGGQRLGAALEHVAARARELAAAFRASQRGRPTDTAGTARTRASDHTAAVFKVPCFVPILGSRTGAGRAAASTQRPPWSVVPVATVQAPVARSALASALVRAGAPRHGVARDADAAAADADAAARRPVQVLQSVVVGVTGKPTSCRVRWSSPGHEGWSHGTTGWAMSQGPDVRPGTGGADGTADRRSGRAPAATGRMPHLSPARGAPASSSPTLEPPDWGPMHASNARGAAHRDGWATAPAVPAAARDVTAAHVARLLCMDRGTGEAALAAAERLELGDLGGATARGPAAAAGGGCRPWASRRRAGAAASRKARTAMTSLGGSVLLTPLAGESQRMFAHHRCVDGREACAGGPVGRTVPDAVTMCGTDGPGCPRLRAPPPRRCLTPPPPARAFGAPVVAHPVARRRACSRQPAPPVRQGRGAPCRVDRLPRHRGGGRLCSWVRRN